jgi:lysophospholipase L1-like esterase
MAFAPGMRVRSFWSSAATVGFGLLLALAGAEIGLRMIGQVAWWHVSIDQNEPVMHEPDPVLGWRNRPGRYSIPAYVPGGAPIEVTFLPDGRRSTGAYDIGGRPKVLMVGCSFTQGWGVSDDETYPWKLQQRFPASWVLNYGTAAFGTYQSLLTLRRALAQHSDSTAVLYGFIGEHEDRNVAMAEWLEALARYSRRGHVAVPYCLLSATGALACHPPVAYPAWPFHRQLASIAFAEKMYVQLSARRRPEHRRAVTESLLLALRQSSVQHGAKFAVALLSATPDKRSRYTQFLRDHGISFADCVAPLTEEWIVPGDGHPNGAMHARWANCIAEELGEFLSASGAGG